MKKGSKLFIFLIVTLLILPVFADAKVEKISKTIMNTEENQKIRIVVQFKEDSTERKEFSVKNKEISEEKIKYKSGKNVFAILTKEEIEKLALSDSVEFISEEKKYYTSLQESVPLINATASWRLQSLGLNLTGQGQTICIIDTGVNYSHPDLGGCFGNNDNTSDCKIIGGWNTYSGNNETMDDYGHGTHVAGIASAEGGISGTAPFTKIVMIKANVPNTNGFNGADIIEGIDWCVNNASKFNISVISMSLGGDIYYNSYCDNYPHEHSDRDAINRATAKNISVIVASGNNGSKTNISSPACIQNATPVSSTNEADTNISNFANTWNNSLLKIVAAPGETINSTYHAGYGPLSGTSMATPHVAGAIAIINQYLFLSGQTKSPEQIEDLLNATGKQIFDSYANRYFSRIDIYSALMEIDSTSPNVTLASPTNNMVDIDTNQTFICNTSDWQLKNVTIQVWNSTDYYYNETKNISGMTNSTEFNLTNMALGSYFWNCFASDEKGNNDFSISNFSMNIEGIALSLNSPANNTYTNINDTMFNCSATTSSDRETKNMTFFIYENGILSNSSNVTLTGITNSTIFNFTFVNESNYTWRCEVYSNETDYDAENYTIYYDITYANLSSISEMVTTNQVTIAWTTDEETNYSISLNSRANNSFLANHNLAISGLSTSTTYEYNLTYCDRANNCNVSLRSFTTLTNPSTSSGGGGGGGGSTQTKITENQLAQGYSKKYSIGEKISFISKGQNHSLQLNRILNNTANITVRSNPINFLLAIGEEKKINLTSAEYYDLYIKVENVTKYNANITIKSIEELIIPHKIIKYDNQTLNKTTDKGEKYEPFGEEIKNIKRDLLPLYAIFILLICTFFYFLLKRKFEKKKKKKTNK